MKGKIVVATGATSGVGEAAVVALARKGARIVFVARAPDRARATLARLERAAPGLGHAFHIADLSSVAETRGVGKVIADSEPRIDVLVNNAGAMFADRKVTAEGLEMTFAVNHMAYFVLTAALEERLKASAPARIVSTSSAAHARAELDFSDLQSAKGYSGWRTYSRSKLANILFTREAARRLAGSGVTANCFHPGVIASRFGSASGGLTTPLLALVRPLLATPEQGADTLVYLASAPEVASETGAYFVKRRVVEPSAAARDESAAKTLWQASEALAGQVA